MLFLFLFLWYGIKKGTLCATFHWPMMKILFLICFILKCHVSLYFSQMLNQWFLGIFCHKFLGQPKDYINSNFRFRSTAPLGVSQLLLPKSSEHRTADQYHRSANNGELNLKSDVNRPASGKLRQSNTVSSQCEIFS